MSFEMLTPNQEEYLLTVPEDKIARVKPYDPKVKEATEEIVSEIKNALPEAKILLLGASALEIAGQNDIDISVLSEKFEESIKILENTFGKPIKSGSALAKWEFVRGGFEVELYLNREMTPTLQEQIDTFNLLKNNGSLRSEYEKIKIEADGLPFREYMRKKYEFFNKII